MIRPLRSAAAVFALLPAALAAQLPMITVPAGALRIDATGAFYPSNDIWDNGGTRPFGSLLNAANNGMVTSLERGLSQAIGQPVTGLTLGGISAIADRAHGVGDIGLALGVTKRITIFGTVPIVYVRTQVSMTYTPAAGRLGFNPASTLLGTAQGRDQTTTFFSDFDAALAALSDRIQQGAYTGDPASLTLAQQTLSSGTAMRGSLFSLLADQTHASAVLPVSTDPAAVQLIGTITTLQSTLANRLGVADFTSLPALPASPLTSDDFGTLLGSPGGFGVTLPNSILHFGLGDMTTGVAIQLRDRPAASGAGHQAAWLRLTARLPTATVADQSVLLEQPTGSKSPAVTADAIVEVAKSHLGLRAEATYQHQFAASEVERVASPDAPLVPASFLAAITTQPGDSIAITARPFFRFAPHLALAGVLQYWRLTASNTSYLAGQAPIPGVDASVLDIGSAANAVVVGIGLSYSHDGVGRDGHTGSPVEAGWSIERTIASGAGIFPAALTTRVYLRIYRPLLRH
ncbi:MAG TPA: hypothetical protein VGL65_12850 [Gemmatimonadales bacterium]